MISWLFVFIILFIWFLLGYVFRDKFFGWYGEIVLHWLLKSKLDRKQYIVMHDIMLPTEEGTTTQIDHIVISKGGIFVIETKTHKGTIYGKASDKDWTEKYHWRGKGYPFQNPLKQNYKHIATLAECLGIGKEYFKNVVAFAGTTKFGKEMPEGVMYFIDVPSYIRENSTEEIIPQEQVQEVADAIVAWQNTLSRAQKAAHVENLQKTHSYAFRKTRKPSSKMATQEAPAPTVETSTPPAPAVDASGTTTAETSTPVIETAAPTTVPELTPPLCPKCGVPMVLRTRKSNGGKLWGCPNYPKCHHIVNVSE